MPGLLILDDFCLQPMDAADTADTYELGALDPRRRTPRSSQLPTLIDRTRSHVAGATTVPSSWRRHRRAAVRAMAGDC
jgi:hypothetical protein